MFFLKNIQVRQRLDLFTRVSRGHLIQACPIPVGVHAFARPVSRTGTPKFGHAVDHPRKQVTSLFALPPNPAGTLRWSTPTPRRAWEGGRPDHARRSGKRLMPYRTKKLCFQCDVCCGHQIYITQKRVFLPTEPARLGWVFHPLPRPSGKAHTTET